jgi:APA family basic amino acid/polyamine antiporter
VSIGTRRGAGLERVLGANALFATAYGNVGSSIYYALGVTAALALGLTPIAFLIAGLIFLATAATYAEGTVRFPEAGGSSSFARHAFNEVVSFGAAWAQMLNYVITIAISAFFVPHYLSVFWDPLKENPWDIVVGAIVIAALVALNVLGVQEAARLNVVLAVVDLATQVLLVLAGIVLVLSPSILTGNVSLGVAPSWSQFALAVPVAMIAYTGIETISNLAEEVRDPARDVPRSISMTVVAVLVIYATLPAVALSALPVTENGDGSFQTLLGLPPEEGGYANDPVLGVIDNFGLSSLAQGALGIYVGLLAATILLVAANAGVIGASRITYSMASYRHIPETFRRLHRRFKTPATALVVFGGVIPILALLPGQTDFLGSIYAFGAMLSFTVAHVSLVALRVFHPEEEPIFRARPNLRLGGIDWPLFAIVGGLATGIAWLVVVVEDAPVRWAGLAWLAVGGVGYVAYRRFALREPLTSTVRAPARVAVGATGLEYRSIVVPVLRDHVPHAALATALRLAADRMSTIAIVRPLKVPLDQPMDARLAEDEHLAGELLDAARRELADAPARVVTRITRTRDPAAAIAEEALARDAEAIVLATAPTRTREGAALFSETVERIVRTAPCHVVLVRPRDPGR